MAITHARLGHFPTFLFNLSRTKLLSQSNFNQIIHYSDIFFAEGTAQLWDQLPPCLHTEKVLNKAFQLAEQDYIVRRDEGQNLGTYLKMLLRVWVRFPTAVDDEILSYLLALENPDQTMVDCLTKTLDGSNAESLYSSVSIKLKARLFKEFSTFYDNNISALFSALFDSIFDSAKYVRLSEVTKKALQNVFLRQKPQMTHPDMLFSQSQPALPAGQGRPKTEACSSPSW